MMHYAVCVNARFHNLLLTEFKLRVAIGPTCTVLRNKMIILNSYINRACICFINSGLKKTQDLVKSGRKNSDVFLYQFCLFGIHTFEYKTCRCHFLRKFFEQDLSSLAKKVVS